MNRKLVFLKTKKNAILLALFATVCTLTVSLTHLLTKPIIEQQKQLEIFNKLGEVLQQDKFDNNPLENCTWVQNTAMFGHENPVKVYRATLSDAPYAIVFQTQTKQGYNGLIELMVAVDSNGQVQGVRTISHQETPGLGDKIELAKSDWVLSFNDKKVKSDTDPRWHVKKDGGQFDQFTGATVTPRAIVNQLRTATFATQSQFETIFAAANDCAATTDGVSDDN